MGLASAGAALTIETTTGIEYVVDIGEMLTDNPAVGVPCTTLASNYQVWDSWMSSLTEGQQGGLLEGQWLSSVVAFGVSSCGAGLVLGCQCVSEKPTRTSVLQSHEAARGASCRSCPMLRLRRMEEWAELMTATFIEPVTVFPVNNALRTATRGPHWSSCLPRRSVVAKVAAVVDCSNPYPRSRS